MQETDYIYFKEWTDYNPLVISYLKEYPISVLQYYKTHDFSISRQQLNNILSPFRTPSLVNNKPCWVVQYANGSVFTYYNTSANEWTNVLCHNDEETRPILYKYGSYDSNSDKLRAHSNLWNAYVFKAWKTRINKSEYNKLQQPNNEYNK